MTRVFFYHAEKQSSEKSQTEPQTEALVRLFLVRPAQFSEIEFFHSEERLRYASHLLGRAVAHHFAHLSRDDLP